MKPVTSLIACSLVAALAVSCVAQADVIVGDLTGPQTYNSIIGGKRAYAIGTTSCNIGTVPLLWIASTNQHPVIGQNIYRIKDGQFEQIGFSWLKHGFTALQQNLCGSCSANPNGSALGVGCSDPYGAGLNGQQGGLGPRYQVNPLTGVFPYPFANPPVTDNLSRRIQVDVADVDPSQNAGAVYIGEGQYISPDDAAAGNGGNNASYRFMTFGANGANASWAGPTVREEPAIMAWPVVDPAVQVEEIVDNGEHFFVGFNAVPAGSGLTRYIYAVHNLNSDRAIGAFSVALPSGASASNLTFHGISHHSGDVWASGNAWTGTVTSNGVAFVSPDTFFTNPNGRAIRWGQTFTFTFESDAEPGDVTLDFFKTAGSLVVPAFTVPSPQWAVNSSSATFTFDGATNNTYTGPIELTAMPAEPIAMTLGTSIASAPYDLALQLGAGVGVNEGGLNLSGTIVNIDASQPFTWLFDGFVNTWTGGIANFPATAPIPNGLFSGQFFAVDASAAAGFSTSALNRVTVDGCYAFTMNHTLGDDDAVEVTFGAGGDFDCLDGLNHYGVLHGSVFINSNGSVSFGGPDVDFSPTTAEFLSGLPKVAAAWTDLDPTAGGTISSSSTATGAFSVEFAGVPAASGAGTLNARIEFVSASLTRVLGYGFPGHTADTLVGITPGGGATSTAVTFSALAGALSVPYNDAVHEFTSGSAPSGYTLLNFIRTATSAFVTSF